MDHCRIICTQIRIIIRIFINLRIHRIIICHEKGFLRIIECIHIIFTVNMDFHGIRLHIHRSNVNTTVFTVDHQFFHIKISDFRLKV